MKHVVTAAHCVRGDTQKPKNMDVLAGSTLRTGDQNGQIRKVARIAKHEEYSSNDVQNDIAVLILLKSFEATQFVQPIKLPEAGYVPSVGDLVTVSGWGKIYEGGISAADKLQFVRKPIVDVVACNKSYSGQVSEGMLCAGTKKGGKDSCQGDSGGPMTLNNALTGVVSWGRGCGRVGFPGVYTRVSHYVSWILEHIAEQ